MNWMNKLERKLGKYAIRNLMLYIIILYVVGFVLEFVSDDFYYLYLDLNADAILNHGQVWRLVTFLMQPPSSSPIFMIFALYLYYMIGRQLEYVWGAFRFNLYFFMGVIFHIVAALLVYLIFGMVLPVGTAYLNLSLFFAYAAVYPNQQFYIFMVIPIKVKWLAWIDGAYFIFTIISAFHPVYSNNYVKASAVAAVVSILNFLIFFLSTRNMRRFAPKEIKRKQAYKKQVRAGQSQQQANGARHRCAVCGRTELDDPNLEFRYCSKCNGNYEYCQDHLFTHEHVK